jgi:hypothetical protein
MPVVLLTHRHEPHECGAAFAALQGFDSPPTHGRARSTSPFQLSIPLDYVETTIPPGMTIAEYRRSGPPRASRRGRLWRRRVAASPRWPQTA